jgi:hypothetical protein
MPFWAGVSSLCSLLFCHFSLFAKLPRPLGIGARLLVRKLVSHVQMSAAARNCALLLRLRVDAG